MMKIQTICISRKKIQPKTLRGNISLSDQSSAYVYYLKDRIGTLLKYRRLYRNWVSVSTRVLRKRYPIQAILRNGNKLLLRNEFEAQIRVVRHHGFKYGTENDTVTLSMPSCLDDKMKIRLHGGISNGDIIGIYLD